MNEFFQINYREGKKAGRGPCRLIDLRDKPPNPIGETSLVLDSNKSNGRCIDTLRPWV
jgi:hypothetical protein